MRKPRINPHIVSFQMRKLRWKVRVDTVRRDKKMEFVHKIHAIKSSGLWSLIRSLYVDYQRTLTTIRKQTTQKKSAEDLNTSLKKIREMEISIRKRWQKHIWKDVPYYISSGKCQSKQWVTTTCTITVPGIWNAKNTKCWSACSAIGTLLYCWWECKML